VQRKIVCVLSGADLEGETLVVRFSPVRGVPPEVVDRIAFGPDGDVATVAAVGRFLRILRAGRVRAPENPYGLHADLEQAEALLQRCRGAQMILHVERRYERSLVIWTESGVERIGSVLDFTEEADSLAVRRRGGQSVLRIPRDTMIRYEAASTEYLQVTAVESVS
jgi:hypothetical protein